VIGSQRSNQRMEFALKDDAREAFEDSMESVAPWFHSYRFGESIYTGYYRSEGLGWNETWCNSNSAPDRIARLRAAYERRDLQPWRTLIAQAVAQTGLAPAVSTALDISSAGGRNSFMLADLGFRKVIASEIRPSSHAQHKLILGAIRDDKYARMTETVNDPLSADDPGFPARYESAGVDLACSFGLLYHLANPAQHLINLHAITRRFVVMFTKVHHQFTIPWAGKRGWLPAIEPSDDAACAAFGLGWIPNFWEVSRLAQQVGFDLRWTGYPAPFEANFPYFRRSSMSPGDACSKPASAACSTAPLGISATWTQRTPARSISTRTISCSCSRSRRAPAHLDDRSAS